MVHEYWAGAVDLFTIGNAAEDHPRRSRAHRLFSSARAAPAIPGTATAGAVKHPSMIQRDQLSSRDRHRGRGRLHSSPAGGRGCIESKILCRRCRQQQPGEGTVRTGTLAERDCAKGRIVLVQKGPQLILPPRPRMKIRRESEIPACQRSQDSRSPGRSMFCIGTHADRIHQDRPPRSASSSKRP